MHKLDKYCRRFTNNFIESDRSRYYNINNHILRISDHIGMSSSGLFSIVIKGNQYILHHPNSGSVEILNYEGVKAFVKVFAMFPMGQMTMLSQWRIDKHETVSVDCENIKFKKRTISIDEFTSAQQKIIRQFLNQNSSK